MSPLSDPAALHTGPCAVSFSQLLAFLRAVLGWPAGAR